jgi:hypothetical protein
LKPNIFFSILPNKIIHIVFCIVLRMMCPISNTNIVIVIVSIFYILSYLISTIFNIVFFYRGGIINVD